MLASCHLICTHAVDDVDTAIASGRALMLYMLSCRVCAIIGTAIASGRALMKQGPGVAMVQFEPAFPSLYSETADCEDAGSVLSAALAL